MFLSIFRSWTTLFHVLLFVILYTMYSIEAEIQNQKVMRTIDLTSQLVKVHEDIIIRGAADNVYLYNIWEHNVKHLAFIDVHTLGANSENKLRIEKMSEGQFKIYLNAEATKKGIRVKSVFSQLQNPFPKEIKQDEKQFVKFRALVKFFSPYMTLEQQSKFMLAKLGDSGSINIISFTQNSEVQPYKKSESSITYGPYKNTEANTKTEIELHFENNQPFLVVSKLKRVIEISLWGNVAVEETIDVFHAGAKLSGPFSRFDHQRSPKGSPHVDGFVSHLPAAARDVYYRDVIGNVSTSHLREGRDSVELELRPRFPLLGGWKTQYIIGYNVPSYELLLRQGDRFVLKSRFVDHLFDDQVIQEMLLQVILPEKSHSLKWKLPYDVKELPLSHIHTYLDAGGEGRPVVSFSKTNLVEPHIQDFTLEFHFSIFQLIREPLFVIVGAFILFATIIICARLDFSLVKDTSLESRLKIRSIVGDIQNALDKRSALYQAYEDSLKKFKASKDTTKFAQERKIIESDHKSLTAQVAALQTKLRDEAATNDQTPEQNEANDKVGQIQRLDVAYKEQIQQSIALAEKLLGGKITKQVYVESEGKIALMKAEILQKSDAIINNL